MSSKLRASMELGVRYYDNSSRSGTIAGGDNSLMQDYGNRERARLYRDNVMNHREYTGVRFMQKKPLMLEVKVSSRSNIRNLRKKQSRWHSFINFFSSFNLIRGLNSMILRLNPFATYHAAVRWSLR